MLMEHFHGVLMEQKINALFTFCKKRLCINRTRSQSASPVLAKAPQITPERQRARESASNAAEAP